MDDNRTLTPVYKFAWDDGRVRRTDDHDAIASHEEWTPDAVEALAQLGREDDACEVTLLGMSNT